MGVHIEFSEHKTERNENGAREMQHIQPQKLRHPIKNNVEDFVRN